MNEPCPSPENLALFAEGRLRGDDRGPLLAHLAHCPDCHSVVAETVHFIDEAAPAPTAVLPFRFPPRMTSVVAPAAAAALLIIALGPWRTTPNPERTPEWLAEAPWGPSHPLAFAPHTRSPSSTAVWLGLHAAALDRACRETTSAKAALIRSTVAQSLTEGGAVARAEEILGTPACLEGRAAPTLFNGVDKRWLNVGRILARWRIAAVEQDPSNLAVADVRQLKVLAQELPWAPPAQKALESVFERTSSPPTGPPDWEALRAAIEDLIAVLVA